MINDAWDSEIDKIFINLTYKKTSETCMIPISNINNMTEETLQGFYGDMLTDKDVIIAFKILFNYMRNR